MQTFYFALLCINQENRLYIHQNPVKAGMVAHVEEYKYSSFGDYVHHVNMVDVLTKNTYLRELKQKYNLSIRQIERLTGINRGIVLKV